MYINPYVPDCECVMFGINDTTDKNDLIFSTNDSKVCFTSSDITIGAPAHKQYIFHNTEHALSAMHANNIVTPIIRKYNLTQPTNKNRMTALFNRPVEEHGIYIVDIYTIVHPSLSQIDDLVEYYKNCVTLPYSAVINDSIITKACSVKYPENGNVAEIRIITYIPYSSLSEHMFLFIPTSNIVLGKSNEIHRTFHPNSNASRNSTAFNLLENKNMFILDIVNNARNKPYYIKIGNDIRKIFPTKDPMRENGAVISHCRNKEIIKEEIISLKDLPKYGVYKTYDEALTEGNVIAINEKKKLEIEDKKYRLEIDKLNGEMEKLKNEKIKLEEERNFLREKMWYELEMQKHKFTLSKLDIDKKYLDLRLKIKESNVNLNQLMAKYALETSMVEKKHALDMKKANADLGVRLITFGQTIIKAIFS